MRGTLLGTGERASPKAQAAAVSLVLVVTDQIYQSIIRHGYTNIDKTPTSPRSVFALQVIGIEGGSKRHTRRSLNYRSNTAHQLCLAPTPIVFHYLALNRKRSERQLA